MAVTEFNQPDPGWVGAVTILHADPFQCSMSAVPVFPLDPTAHTSLVATPDTPKNSLLERAGVGTTLQDVPLKCSASGWIVLLPAGTKDPTAQMSLAAIAAVALTGRGGDSLRYTNNDIDLDGNSVHLGRVLT